jgi:hypothetical protein
MDAQAVPYQTLQQVEKKPEIEVKDDPMKPRRLTEAEIKEILSVVPGIKSAAIEVALYNRESMLKTLREQLKEIYITPLGLQDVKDEIVRQFHEAVIKPGSVVGVTAAEALGQPITQMALNSFHQSGSSKNVTGGIDGIRELINASKELKNTSCSIFFKNQNLSFDDIVTKVRPAITEIKVSALVKGIPDIETFEQISQDEPWWYGPYRTLIRGDFKSNSILRLDIDVDQLYAYKITMEDIARVIEQDQSVICVYSPMNIGKIHIYPIEKTVVTKIKSEGVIDRTNASMVFLWEIVIPALDKIIISGISGIRQIYPVEAPVWQIVKEEQRSDSVERGWFLILNEVRMRITGIKTEKLTHLCEVAGMTVFKVRPEYIGVQTPDGKSPTELVNRLIKADKEAEKEYEARKRKEGARVIRRLPTDIMTASHLVYADSDGSLYKGSTSTLRTLLAHPNIDSTRTYCNNVHEINEVLGIEAARSFLIKAFSDAISYEGAYINPRHIVLLVDFMVSLGQVNGITFSGISRQPIGALEKASFEQAMETFKEAAGFGESKEVKGTSASIYVGKRAQIGTGYSSQFIDRSKFKPLEEEIIADPNMKLDIGAFKDAISEMTDIISGADVLVPGGYDEDEDEMFAGDGDDLNLPDGVVNENIQGTFDPRAFEQIKGPLVRAKELEEAALKLNEAPCLVAPKQTQIRVEDIGSPLRIEQLPITVPKVQTLPTGAIALTPTSPSVQPGPMGLPDILKRHMEAYTYTEPPKQAPQPLTGLPEFPLSPIFTPLAPEEPIYQPPSPVFTPLPPLAPVGSTYQPPVQKEEKPAQIMFDLENFLK